MHNIAVKGMRRPAAVLMIGFLSRFDSFAKRPLAAYPLPLR